MSIFYCPYPTKACHEIFIRDRAFYAFAAAEEKNDRIFCKINAVIPKLTPYGLYCMLQPAQNSKFLF